MKKQFAALSCLLLMNSCRGFDRSPSPELFSTSDSPGWVSSGGEVFHDRRNPWFLENTKKATYCIKVSEDEISTAPSKIEEAVREGLEFWKQEFRQFDDYFDQQNSLYESPRFVKLATQQFVFEETCSDATDIRFLFGYASLSSIEKEKLGTRVQDYIGLSVRTHYDREHMKGRGFIFFASDRGHHQLRREEGMLKEFWSYSYVLKCLIIHELGHVFGLSHDLPGIMSEEAARIIVHDWIGAGLFEIEDFDVSTLEGSVFGPPKNFKDCWLAGVSADWFGVASSSCLRFELNGATPPLVRLVNEFSYSVFEVHENGDEAYIGRITRSLTWASTHSEYPVTIFLPPERKVFTEHKLQESEDFSFLSQMVIGAEYLEMEVPVFFEDKFGLQKPAYLRLKGAEATLMGEHQGEIHQLTMSGF